MDREKGARLAVKEGIPPPPCFAAKTKRENGVNANVGANVESREGSLGC